MYIFPIQSIFFSFPSFYFFWKSYFFLLHTLFLFLFVPCLKFLFIVYFSSTLPCFEMMMSLYKWVWQWGYLRNSLKIFAHLLRVKGEKQAGKLDRLIWLPVMNVPLLPYLCVTHFQSLTWGSWHGQLSNLWSGEGVVHSHETSLTQCALCSQRLLQVIFCPIWSFSWQIYVFHPLPGDSCTGTFRV